MSFESLNDPVDVLTAFVDGRIQPLRFRWQGRVVRVRRVTGEWNRREGSTLLRYFSIEISSTSKASVAPPLIFGGLPMSP